MSPQVPQTKVADFVPTISLADFDNRKHEIAKQLGDAARDVGFFYIADHGYALK